MDKLVEPTSTSRPSRLLALARVIWLGFPLHPLGFALAFTPAMNALWSSIAAGHLVKRLGLRFGGVQLSRIVLRPFFVGLFVGDLLTVQYTVGEVSQTRTVKIRKADQVFSFPAEK